MWSHVIQVSQVSQVTLLFIESRSLFLSDLTKQSIIYVLVLSSLLYIYVCGYGCVCVYIYIYICVYVYIYIYICVYMYVSMCVYVYLCYACV